jgi:hypothetical protein
MSKPTTVIDSKGAAWSGPEKEECPLDSGAGWLGGLISEMMGVEPKNEATVTVNGEEHTGKRVD